MAGLLRCIITRRRYQHYKDCISKRQIAARLGIGPASVRRMLPAQREASRAIDTFASRD
jgi:hypothetical protein